MSLLRSEHLWTKASNRSVTKSESENYKAAQKPVTAKRTKSEKLARLKKPPRNVMSLSSQKNKRQFSCMLVQILSQLCRCSDPSTSGQKPVTGRCKKPMRRAWSSAQIWALLDQVQTCSDPSISGARFFCRSLRILVSPMRRLAFTSGPSFRSMHLWLGKKTRRTR